METMSVILRVLPDIAIRTRHLSTQNRPLFRLNNIILKFLFTKYFTSVSASITEPQPTTAKEQRRESVPGSIHETSNLEWVNRNGLCGELCENDVGKRVRLCGWVALHRGHGGLTFVSLRDHSGIVQVTTLPNEFPEAHSMVNDLRLEYVVSIEGVVRLRPSDSVNKNMKTGMIEVTAEHVQVLNSMRAKLPFLVTSSDDAKDSIKEEIRLRVMTERSIPFRNLTQHVYCTHGDYAHKYNTPIKENKSTLSKLCSSGLSFNEDVAPTNKGLKRKFEDRLEVSIVI